jgi:hypothetical protein
MLRLPERDGVRIAGTLGYSQMSFSRKRESTTRRCAGNSGIRRAVGIHPHLV